MENHLKGSNEKKTRKKNARRERGWTQYWNGSRYTWCMQAFWIRFAAASLFFHSKQNEQEREQQKETSKHWSTYALTYANWRRLRVLLLCHRIAPATVHAARCHASCVCVCVCGTRITLLVVVCSTILLISLQMKKCTRRKEAKRFSHFFPISFQCGERSILLKMVLLCF